MNNLKTLISTICIFSLLINAVLCNSSVPVGEYIQKGHIVWVKSNHQGSFCGIKLEYLNKDKGTVEHQFGEWNCNSFSGQGTLSVAKLAHILRSNVEVIFEGNGAHFKPVQSISLV